VISYLCSGFLGRNRAELERKRRRLHSDSVAVDELNTASATRATCSSGFLSDLSRAIARMP